MWKSVTTDFTSQYGEPTCTVLNLGCEWPPNDGMELSVVRGCSPREPYKGFINVRLVLEQK